MVSKGREENAIPQEKSIGNGWGLNLREEEPTKDTVKQQVEAKRRKNFHKENADEKEGKVRTEAEYWIWEPEGTCQEQFQQQAVVGEWIGLSWKINERWGSRDGIWRQICQET